MPKKILNINFVLTIIYFVEIITSQKILSLEYFEVAGTINIRSTIGKNQSKIFEIGIASNWTYIGPRYYKREKSESAKVISNGNFSKKGYYLQYDKMTEELILHSNKTDLILREFPFYYFKTVPTFQYDTISLPSNFSDLSVSFIHYLYNLSLIDHLAFGFEIEAINETLGFLHFGGFPEQLIQSKKYINECKLNQRENKWGCDLLKVTVGFMEFKNHIPLYFNSQLRHIKIPSNFYNFLRENFFKELIEEKKCKSFIRGFLFECDCKSLKRFPDITLFFEGFNISLKIEDYTKHFGDSEKCSLLFEKGINEAWEIGIDFLKHNLILFDYENKRIKFYTDIPGILDVKKQVIEFIIIILDVILVAEIFIISYYKKKTLL